MGYTWGVSTRLIGGLIMTHSDDEGLVLPPKLAPIQVVIVPIPKPDPELLSKASEISAALKSLGIKVKIDTDETKRPGFKFAEYEMKGVPVRLGLGKRDLENNTIEVARRDTKEKSSIALDNIVPYIVKLLADIQDNLFNRAKAFRDTHITSVDNYEEFKNLLESKGGFFYCHWDGTPETEEKIKEETKATIRCIPFDMLSDVGICMYSGKPSSKRVIFAKAY